jgi:NADH:ubiquinone oxidoreductase subunit H
LGALGLFSIRSLIQVLIIIVFIYLSVCFLTLLERKILRYAQNRKGPNKVGFLGLIQPLLDGGKLIFKDWKVYFISYFVFILIPILIIVFISLMLTFIFLVYFVNVHNNSILFILVVSSLIVYVIFSMG